MRSVSTLARWLHQVRRSLASSAVEARRERAVRRLRAHDTAADPWLAEERQLLAAPAVVLSVASATYTENAPPVTLDPMVKANDPDADLIKSAQIKIVDYEMGQDQLSFISQFGITGSFNNMTGILTLNGVTTANNYATVLSSVKYQNLTDAPSDLARTIEFTITDTGSNTSAAATLTLNLISVADTPANVMAAVNEDTLSAPIVLAPNPIDGATVTHFQITGITNGTLYQNDGVTQINNGDFITAANAAAGVKFQGNLNYYGPAEFKFQAAVGNMVGDLGGNIATASITVNPVADTPANVMVVVNEDTLSGPIVLTPNAVDGASVTHFQITGITNGTLYLNDGFTVVNNGDFVTVADAALGLKYQGNLNYFGPAQFQFQAAVGNTVPDLGGAIATATITVNPIADTPANAMANVAEDTLSAPIILMPNMVDGASVTHFQITGITNGTLYQADGVTVINNGDFITLAQATAGVTFQGNADYFGPAQFQFQASTSNMVAGLAGALATASITVNPIADTPANVMASVNEDTLSGPIVLTPNAVDGASVTHFQITGITNGTLYLNDGITVVNNGDFITVADAALGLKYQGNLNYFGPAQFQFQAAVGNTVPDLGGGIATASITVNPVADTPANVMAAVNEDTLSGPIVLTPNAVDGASATHFQITGITNGTLYLNDGVTVVNNGDFVTVADAALGLKYLGNLNYFGPAQFQYQAALGNTVGDLGGAVATATITVNPIADTPGNVMAAVNEDTLSGPIVLTPNAVDGASATHFQITGITNGTLYLNDGITVVNNGDFVTAADAALGLKYQGNLNYFGPAEFKFQAAVGNTPADLGGAIATASITVNPIADTPANVVAVVNEDTLSGPIILTPNAVDGASATHFQITGITNGTLYLNDGVTVVNNGDFITVAQAALGLKYQGNLNFFGPAEFKFQAAIGNTIGDLGGAKATASITVNPIADTPANVMVIVNEDTLSSPIVLMPNPVDGASVTHFQITGITNGTLYLDDGVTMLNNGDFVTAAQAALGLKYQGNLNYFGPAEFKFQAAVGPTVGNLGGGIATASITVNPVADTPANVAAVVNEDTLSGPIVLSPNTVDGATATHFQITGITNGTLYLNDGVTVVNNGNFVTVAQAALGLKFQGSLNFFGPAEFKFQAAVGNTLPDLGGGIATASITVKPIADTPPDVAIAVNEDTLSGPIVIMPNGVDLASVTHFRITGITNGTLYLNDGVTMVSNGTLITAAQALAGLKYQGNLNYFGPAEFKFQAAVGPLAADLGGSIATATITVISVNDNPTITVPGPQATAEGTQISLNGILIDDVDVAANPLTVEFQITGPSASYTLGSTAGITFLTGTNGGSVPLKIQGTLTDLQLALSDLKIQPHNNGLLNLKLVITDELNGSNNATIPIIVANVAPRVDPLPAMIKATDIDGQFYTYVDITVDDPGDDSISITIDWSDISPDDNLYDPFVIGEVATTRNFGTVTHRYLIAPNPQDPLAPVTITFTIFDGTDTVTVTRTVNVTGQGIPAGGVYITPEPEEIILPAVQASVVPPLILTQPAQQQVRNEEIVSREEGQTDEEARLVLHVVGPTGVEGPAVTLPDGLLQNLRGLFAKLPDGHYRVYLVQGESRRLVIEVFVRQGRAIDPAEVDQGTQERPPQVQPAAQQDPDRVMQAEPVGQAVPDKQLAQLEPRDKLAAATDASGGSDPSSRLAELLEAEAVLRQASPDLRATPENELETLENADQAGVLGLAAASVVTSESWRRTARRQRAVAGTTGPGNDEKTEKTWSRLARRARQWKPR